MSQPTAASQHSRIVLEHIIYAEMLDLSSYQYEQLVRELFMFDGFETAVVGVEGDRHIELSLRKGSDTFIAHAQRGHGTVHRGDVLRLRKPVEKAGVTGGYLVTTRKALDSERQLGIGNNRIVRLIDGNDLVAGVARFARASMSIRRAADLALQGDDYRMLQWLSRHHYGESALAPAQAHALTATSGAASKPIRRATLAPGASPPLALDPTTQQPGRLSDRAALLAAAFVVALILLVGWMLLH